MPLLPTLRYFADDDATSLGCALGDYCSTRACRHISLVDAHMNSGFSFVMPYSPMTILSTSDWKFYLEQLDLTNRDTVENEGRVV